MIYSPNKYSGRQSCCTAMKLTINLYLGLPKWKGIYSAKKYMYKTGAFIQKISWNKKTASEKKIEKI